MARLVVGIDVGTASTKGVVCTLSGEVLVQSVRHHSVEYPFVGWAEQDADMVWWSDVADVLHELSERIPASSRVACIAVSAIGPCLLPVAADGTALRPGILYGIDTRASQEIADLEAQIDPEELIAEGGMLLTSQAIGPKLLWLRRHEPDIFDQARWFMTSTSYLVMQLTGSVVMDYHTASHFNPMFNIHKRRWSDRAADLVGSSSRLPTLGWPAEVAGTITFEAALATGMPEGTPVTIGTIDALSEAFSVGVTSPGDLMIMYGSTAFMIQITAKPLAASNLWSTVGALPGTYALAGGLATSGAATMWFRDEFARDLQGDAAYGQLSAEAAESVPGAHGLLFLPHLSGERTPLNDPEARGVLAGFSLAHRRGDVYRALLEGVAFGIRRNISAMHDAGTVATHAVAVGGGTKNRLWTQIVSDTLRIPQILPTRTIGASYGDAMFAAIAVGARDREDIGEWVKTEEVLRPGPAADIYDLLYPEYCELYNTTAEVVHHLAALQRNTSAPPSR